MKDYIKEVSEWEKIYFDIMKDNLSKQQIELLKGRYIKVPKSQIEKDKFWKKFRKKYFKNKH